MYPKPSKTDLMESLVKQCSGMGKESALLQYMDVKMCNVVPFK